MEVQNKNYRIKGNSRYFKEKYGTSNPIINIEGSDNEIWGQSWIELSKSNFACALFASRVKFEDVALGEKAYYGKIKVQDSDRGEVVFDTELEEVS